MTTCLFGLFGGITVLDLRLPGVLGREIALDQLSRMVLPVVHTACAVLLLSGVWLFLYDLIQTDRHMWFLPKLLLILVALANATVFSRLRGFGLRAIGAGALTRHARTAGLVSLVVWGAVIACATGNQEGWPMVRGRGVIGSGITQSGNLVSREHLHLG